MNLIKDLSKNDQDSETIFAMSVGYDYENRFFYWETSWSWLWKVKVNSKFWRKIPVTKGHLSTLGSYPFKWTELLRVKTA